MRIPQTLWVQADAGQVDVNLLAAAGLHEDLQRRSGDHRRRRRGRDLLVAEGTAWADRFCGGRGRGSCWGTGCRWCRWGGDMAAGWWRRRRPVGGSAETGVRLERGDELGAVTWWSLAYSGRR